MEKSRRLRELIRSNRLVLLPGAVNAMTAKLVEAAGFDAVYMTGYGTSLNLLGLPDMGLATMSEVVLNAGYMAQAVQIPLLADADTGYGNAVNVRRTVQNFIRAGVAGIHLEDQVTPKRCGEVAGREVIPLEEMAGKLSAAIDARASLDPELVIIARSDALGAVKGGLEDTIRRGKAYIEAGADAFMIAEAGLDSVDAIRVIARSISGPFICVPIGPLLGTPHRELRQAGLAGAIYPLEVTMFGAAASSDFLHDFRKRGAAALNEWNARVKDDSLGTNDAIHVFAGFPEGLRLLEKYSPNAGPVAGAGWRA